MTATSKQGWNSMSKISIDREFHTKWERRYNPPKTIVGERVVETAGYIPLKKRIENMIAAGQQLQAIREEMYPSPFEEEQMLNEMTDDVDWEDTDEITVMRKGMEAEEKLYSRKPKKTRYEERSETEGQMRPQNREKKKRKSETDSKMPAVGSEEL